MQKTGISANKTVTISLHNTTTQQPLPFIEHKKWSHGWSNYHTVICLENLKAINPINVLNLFIKQLLQTNGTYRNYPNFKQVHTWLA